MKTTLYALTTVLLLSAVTAEVEAQAGAPDAFVQQRKQLAQRQRRVIFNNDGNEIIYFPKDLPVTVENVLARRTSPLLGTHVDSIFYCPISSGFGYFTHNTKVGSVLEHTWSDLGINIARPLIDQGTDALKMIVDFGRANGIEVFFSMRMNDTHDGAHTPEKPYPLFPPLKAKRPDLLMGTYDNRPKHGAWSAMDYTHPEVRDLAFRFFEEVCQNYDVDGIELDFWRHMVYFKSVAWGGTASDAERAMMTDLLRRIRRMADAEGRKRGRPILVAVRVPDSVEYARMVGLDIERWLAEGLIDLMAATCYFQLNPWEHIVALGHKYGVPVYPALSETRVRADGRYRRGAQESYRARAARVWQSGADGVYLFNFFNVTAPMLREIGDPNVLARLDKTYFVNVRDYSPELYVTGGSRHQNLTVLNPNRPLPIADAKPLVVPIHLGERMPPAPGAVPKVKLCLLIPTARSPRVRLNGTELPEGQPVDGWWEYGVPVSAIKEGANAVEIALAAPRDTDATEPGWDVVWTATEKPTAPWSTDRVRRNTALELKDGALLVADRGSEPGDYMHCVYAWNARPDRESVAEVQAKVISGTSYLIFSNGAATDRLRLTPDGISLMYSRLKHEMNTTDAFHTYRVVIQGKDLKVYVDGKLALDASGRFTTAAPGGRSSFQFGAANSPEQGEALWRLARLRTGATSLFDLVMTFDYP
ncbi:MAG TPA: hypothetical protein GX715_11085 [Armatimonadetes bacterium]|jgi:hypothetical protein|nr:hypothetical protein [Armatimonadota bacterium]